MIKAETITLRHALISSWRKKEAVVLAKALFKLQIKITASGGTAEALEKAGIEVYRLGSVTGFDKLLGGRVKTLHPAVYAAILARRDNPSDMDEMQSINLTPIDLVAVDLYPFPEEFDGKSGIPVELIDIGGVALIRAAAKNHEFVTVLSSADQFEKTADSILKSKGIVTLKTSKDLAEVAFTRTSYYDALISEFFKKVKSNE